MNELSLAVILIHSSVRNLGLGERRDSVRNLKAGMDLKSQARGQVPRAG